MRRAAVALGTMGPARAASPARRLAHLAGLRRARVRQDPRGRRMGPADRARVPRGAHRAGRRIAGGSARGDDRGRKRPAGLLPARHPPAVRTLAAPPDLEQRRAGLPLFRRRARKPARAAAQPRSPDRRTRSLPSTRRTRWPTPCCISPSKAKPPPRPWLRAKAIAGWSMRPPQPHGTGRKARSPAAKPVPGCSSPHAMGCGR